MTESATLTGKLFALLIGAVATVFLAELILRIMTPNWSEFSSRRFMQIHPVPVFGTVVAGVPGFDGHFAQNNGDFRVHIQINEFGLRNTRPATASHNNIWVIGDSMAFGWGVDKDEMYSSVIGRVLDQPTYNVASPGTNVCGYQALLARMPSETVPKAVVLGLILENDVVAYNCKASNHKLLSGNSTENNNPFLFISAANLKSWLTHNAALYNFFAVSLKRVDTIRELLTFIGLVNKVDAYRHPGRGEDAEIAIRETVREILVFKSMLRQGTPMTVLLAPGRFEIRDGDKVYKNLRIKLRRALEKVSIDFVDPFTEFKNAGYQNIHFKHDGHWSPLGHQIAGKKTAARLRILMSRLDGRNG